MFLLEKCLFFEITEYVVNNTIFSSKDEKISVSIRIRPLNTREQNDSQVYEALKSSSKKSVTEYLPNGKPRNNSTQEYDNVFDSKHSTEDIFDKHTTHFSCADSAGNWVAITATINTHFGSKVVIPGTGVLMNNEMDDFAVAPGAPNAFGLLGAEANSVEPGKRPLSSMSPTLVLKGNQPVLAVGAAGGPTIITQTLLAMVHTLDYGLSLKEALAQTRFHHQWKPDTLRIELKASITEALQCE